MDWQAFFTTLETSWLSVWVRESSSLLAFPTIIALHAIGMGFLVGASVAMNLRVLGFAQRIPLRALGMLFPNMIFGFVVNAVSGVLLLLAYPTKAMTNPVFYLKLLLIAGATWVAWQMRKRFAGAAGGERPEESSTKRDRMLAYSSLAMWAGAIVAGRFLAYTYKYLTAFDLGMK
jgi:hypothetical protein